MQRHALFLFPLLFPLLSLSNAVQAQTSLEAGSLGYGIVHKMEIEEGLSLSVGASMFESTFESVSLGTASDMDVDLRWASLGVSLGYQIGRSPFSLSVGVRSKHDRIDLSGEAIGSFDFMGQELAYADFSDLAGHVAFDRFAPTVAVRYERTFESGWSVGGTVGAMFQGAPRVHLEATGPLTASPEFLAAVETERAAIARELEDLSIFPVVSLSVGYRF